MSLFGLIISRICFNWRMCGVVVLAVAPILVDIGLMNFDFPASCSSKG
jgi:hypothetical protein